MINYESHKPFKPTDIKMDTRSWRRQIECRCCNYYYYYWTKRLWWRAVKDCEDTELFRKCVRRCSGPETVRHGRNYRTG